MSLSHGRAHLPHPVRLSLLVKAIGLVVMLKGFSIVCYDTARLIEMARWGLWTMADPNSAAGDATVFSKFDWMWQSQHSLYWRVEWLVEGAVLMAIGLWMWRTAGRRFLTRMLLGRPPANDPGVRT